MNTLLRLLAVAAMFVTVTQTLAAPVGSAFNYQGELIVDGSPANGQFDIEMNLFMQATGGTSIIDDFFPAVTVENGLFQIQVDFGDAVFQDNEAFWIELSINETGSATVETLAPRDLIHAVPYAVQAQYLAPGGASSGDVLQFDGNNWVPASAGGSSPWAITATSLTTPKTVGIGEQFPAAQLHIRNSTNQTNILQVANFGSDDMLIVKETGNVGIGVNNPEDRLQVDADTGQSPLRGRINGQTKLRVQANGGTSLGINNPPNTPENGLYVQGDVKQDVASTGLIKYMMRASCDSTPTVTNQYNGTNVAGTATITRLANLTCEIVMPFDVGDNYIAVTPRYINPSSERYVNCNPVGFTLTCRMFSGAGNNTAGGFDILVY